MGRCSCGAGYQPARIPQHGGRGYERGTVGGLQTARRDAGGDTQQLFHVKRSMEDQNHADRSS